MKFSRRAERLTPSATLAVTALAKRLRAEGKPVISFSAGEPDFTSPHAALDAARAAIDRGETHYTQNGGIPELKNEIAGYYQRHFGLTYDASEIIVSSGAKQVLYEATQALVDDGDEVIVFTPAWVSYFEQIALAGGAVVPVETSDTGFMPTRDRIEAALTPRTAGIIVNTPNNPTGADYSEESIRAVADAAREHDLWVIFDEIYERLIYCGNKHVNILNIAPDLRDRVILVNGVSKAFCMTGWRIGWALGPAPIIQKIDSLQSHISSNASSIAQWAAVGALSGAEEDAEKFRVIFEKRRDLTCRLLSEIKGLKVAAPHGAFYAFIDLRGTKIPDDGEFCRRLLAEKYVALVPGAAFMAPGFARMSYACSDENIIDGIGRIKEFVEAL